MSLKSRLNLGGAEPLFLVDGTSFLYRGFYAYPDLKRSDGMATGAIFIVLRILLRILREERPKYLGFFMDGRGPTFRHAMFEPYKAQRPKMPEDLAAQIEPLREAVGLLGLSLTVSDGVEADDCIASLAARHQAERPVVIVASDKDLKQCLTPSVYLWDPAGKAEKLTSEADFRAENGIAPAQWPDLQALMGDSSDNIPGLPGVGPKTALKVIHEFPTLEAVRDNFDKLPESFRKKLDGHVEDVFLYRELTRLKTDACAELDLQRLAVRPPEAARLAEFLGAYEFKSLVREIPQPALVEPPRASDSYDGPPPWEDGGQPGIAPAEAGPANKKPAKPGRQPQLSLFGAPGEAPAPVQPASELPPLPVRHVADAAALPDFSGRVVGLVMLESGAFRLASAEDGEGNGGGETEFSGPAGALAPLLCAARTIAAPSLQDLLRADPAWDAVPLDRWFDLGLAAYLLNPEDRNYSFARLRSAVFLANDPLADPMAAPEAEADAAQPAAEAPPLHPDAQALAALACRETLSRRLRDAGLDELMRELEIPLIPVLAAMERRGVRIDFAAFKAFLEEVSAEAAAHEKRIQELTGGVMGGPTGVPTGGSVNVRSSKQLAELLFKKLGLKPAGKTPGGALSTGSEALEKLAGQHPVIDEILAFRVAEKLRSTYLEPLPRLADESGRLHTRFNQLATATGRLSSSGPNLQNIPIRGSQGTRMRACFIAAPGMLFVGADYSQVELRVLAHFSEDPALIDAFRKDEDIHSRTAALLFDKEPGDISPDERRGAKTINFGLIYGMGPQKLARELSITLNEAKGFIERYFAKLGTLKNFYEGLVQDAMLRGYVTTLAGRRRLLPELHSRNQQVQSQARRQAVNTVIQGSAADVIKLAMLRVNASPVLAALDARLILQVHDELLLEAPEQNAPAAAVELGRIMQSVAELRVPLKVDVGQGRTWAEAH
jgi:DNA polymerase-1